MRIELNWTDPITGDRLQRQLTTPIAIGRVLEQLPAQLNGREVSRVTIQDSSISSYHALIDGENQELTVIDQNSTNGIQLNGVFLINGRLENGDRIQIGNCEIAINFMDWKCDRMVGFLFKRRCGRTSTINCPDCDVSYTEDYAYYPGYGDYRYSNYSYERQNVDFTEADGASFDNDMDSDFERNMGAS